MVKEVFRDSNGYYALLQNETSHKVGRNYVDVIKQLSI